MIVLYIHAYIYSFPLEKFIAYTRGKYLLAGWLACLSSLLFKIFIFCHLRTCFIHSTRSLPPWSWQIRNNAVLIKQSDTCPSRSPVHDRPSNLRQLRSCWKCACNSIYGRCILLRVLERRIQKSRWGRDALIGIGHEHEQPSRLVQSDPIRSDLMNEQHIALHACIQFSLDPAAIETKWERW